MDNFNGEIDNKMIDNKINEIDNHADEIDNQMDDDKINTNDYTSVFENEVENEIEEYHGMCDECDAPLTDESFRVCHSRADWDSRIFTWVCNEHCPQASRAPCEICGKNYIWTRYDGWKCSDCAKIQA